jgi:DNA-binding NtrC family response regulator
MREASLLVVDDDPSSLEFMRQALAAQFAEVRTAADGIEALLAMEGCAPDLLITDLRMPNLDGMELLRLVKERWTEIPVIVVTVEEEIATVVEAVQCGAVNYLTKPATPAVLGAAVGRALSARPASAGVVERSVPEILGASLAMVRVRHLVAVAARSDVNVLITGETGTGKELVARAIHRLSSLSRGPFVAHNCAVSPHDLFESQFFGHRRGAFTSADRDHHGFLEQADNGVLFLDEMECLSSAHQGKLLRFLDDGRIQPVGCEQERLVSVRIVSATNQDPERMLAAGTLRDDFYYRLCGFEIRLPPLRSRRQDIRPLAEHFLSGTGLHLTPEAVDELDGYDWPGNVRQLRNVLGRARAVVRGREIDRRDLSLKSCQPRVPHSGAPSPTLDAGVTSKEATGGKDAPSGKSLRDLERQALLKALQDAKGRFGLAAKSLGIHRSTLRRKLKELRD